METYGIRILMRVRDSQQDEQGSNTMPRNAFMRTRMPGNSFWQSARSSGAAGVSNLASPSFVYLRFLL